MSEMKEEWRPVKGYEESYEVSNTGKARSVDRYDCKGAFRKGVELKVRYPTFCEGEPYVRLTKNGHARDLNLYRLISKVFTHRRN